MDESILNSIKKLLGIAEDYNYFDQDIIMDINAALMILTQLVYLFDQIFCYLQYF